MNPNIKEARERDFSQVLKDSFDPQEQRIRVEALVTDGTDAMIVNTDGSINVNIVDGVVANNTYVSSYNEVTAVPSATATTVNTYIVPLATVALLKKISVSGTNIATYEVKINSVVQDKQRTYFGDSLNYSFNFEDSSFGGYPLATGDIVVVSVTHSRPSVGDFNSRIQVMEIP